jgi:hypothetical protein
MLSFYYINTYPYGFILVKNDECYLYQDMAEEPEPDTDAVWESPDEQTVSDGAGQTVADSLVSVGVGDVITFGQYEQDANSSNGKEDIEWLVLDREEDKILVISQYCLTCDRYDYATAVSADWESCALRAWLNDDFLNTAFSADERSCIVSVELENADNAVYGTEGGNNTTDLVFLLSTGEAERYFSSKDARRAEGTPYAKSQGIYVNTSASGVDVNQHIDGSGYGYSWWWLRTPGGSASEVACVLSDGGIDLKGSTYTQSGDNDGGVRPAMWIDLTQAENLGCLDRVATDE